MEPWQDDTGSITLAPLTLKSHTVDKTPDPTSAEIVSGVANEKTKKKWPPNLVGHMNQEELNYYCHVSLYDGNSFSKRITSSQSGVMWFESKLNGLVPCAQNQHNLISLCATAPIELH